MIHNLKKTDGTIEAVDCKLGSGVFDKNGREIFEDDKIKLKTVIPSHDTKGFCLVSVDVELPVVFKDGALQIVVEPEKGALNEFGLPEQTLFSPLSEHDGNCYEIVND